MIDCYFSTIIRNIYIYIYIIELKSLHEIQCTTFVTISYQPLEHKNHTCFIMLVTQSIYRIIYSNSLEKVAPCHGDDVLIIFLALFDKGNEKKSIKMFLYLCLPHTSSNFTLSCWSSFVLHAFDHSLTKRIIILFHKYKIQIILLVLYFIVYI